MRSYWAFNIGADAGADWLADWRHHTAEMWFTPNKKPTGVRQGERAVINAGRDRLFVAAVQVVSAKPEPNRDAGGAEQYPWILRHRLLVAIRADHNAPSLEDVDWEDRRSLFQNPHVKISAAMYERVSGAIIRGAGRAVA